MGSCFSAEEIKEYHCRMCHTSYFTVDELYEHLMTTHKPCRKKSGVTD